MSRKLLVILVIVFACLPIQVFAQGPVALPAAEVELWPEYDRPGVLVIYRFTLPASASLPADVVMRIPAAAGKPNAVAMRQADGALINATYESVPSGSWNQITIKATTPEIQVEYYDPGLVKQGSIRHYEYRWPGDYAVQTMTVRVQQPVGAYNMRISPDLGSGTAGSDGLTYYSAEVGSLGLGQSFAILLDYQKNVEDLSVSTLAVKPSSPITDNTPGRFSLMSTLPWILGGVGLLLIVGGGLWYWQSGRSKLEPGRRQRRRSAAQKQTEKPNPQASTLPQEESHVYCHQCGKRAAPGDRFCRTCGAALRLG